MTARDYALLLLDRTALPGWPRALGGGRFAPPEDRRDRALGEQIHIGVVKNLLHLQYLIEYFAQRPAAKIDPLAQKVLAIGLYQFRFLTRIPPSAAVDQAVEQVRRFGRGRAAGFVNAVLRRALRGPEAPLPDRHKNPREYARLVLSHPPELFDRLAELAGADEALRLCEHANAEPPTILRLFEGITIERLAPPADITLTPHEQAGMVVMSPVRPALLEDWSARGKAQAQDPTAALPVRHCGIAPGQTLLDRCAGLGTKTMQMRDLLGERGRIVAVDPNGERCRILRELLARRAIANVTVAQAGRTPTLADLPAVYDIALVDVPCSNSGVLARRPEARYSQNDTALASLATLQKEILADTAPRVRPGGLLVYSTCSIWPEENQRQVAWFVQTFPQFTLEMERATLPMGHDQPTHYRDGGYFALLRKRVQ